MKPHSMKRRERMRMMKKKETTQVDEGGFTNITGREGFPLWGS